MFDIAAVLILRGFSKKGYTSLFLRQIGAHLKNVWTIYNKHMMISHCFPFWRKNTGEYPPVSIQLNKCPFLAVEITAFGECVCVCVCVCVFFPFILDIRFVGRTSRGHTGGRSHRISHPPSFCGACLNFSREKDSAVPFPRRREVEFCVLTI